MNTRYEKHRGREALGGVPREDTLRPRVPAPIPPLGPQPLRSRTPLGKGGPPHRYRTIRSEPRPGHRTAAETVLSFPLVTFEGKGELDFTVKTDKEEGGGGPQPLHPQEQV